jgi:Recombinase/Recombinase zinc beta ribbon domain
LLEICAFTDTLILDEDGLYDPAHFNDRLLLGLQGTMSEAELHVMQARMRGGWVNKARRGELRLPLPVGFLYDTEGPVILDPDQQVQQSIRTLFQSFPRLGSAGTVVKAFRDAQLLFPHRPRGGPQDGELLWLKRGITQVLFVLHNPRYAGAFVYGRTRVRRTLQGTQQERVPQAKWHTLRLGSHLGYISWDEYQENQRQLQANAHALGPERRKSPPREGPALLQGLVICGICGERMKVICHVRAGRRVPDYICDGRTVDDPQPICQGISGKDVDEAVGELLLEIVTPVAIEVTLAVQQELQARLDEVERLRKEQVERARYEAELAQRRSMRVDPDNRLVADTLEADWNRRLRALQEAQQEYEQQRRKDCRAIDEELRSRLHTLATDFPRLGRDPNTPDRERKRLAHLLLEDVTLIKREPLLIHIRFPGGATRTLELPRPRRATVTQRSVIAVVDRLLDEHSHEAIANILNSRGSGSGYGKAFTGRMIGRVRSKYGLKRRCERLRAKAMLTREEMARRLGISTKQVTAWRAAGLLRGHLCNDKDEYLYEDPGSEPPRKAKGVRLSKRLRFENVSQRPSEVQCEA